MSGARARRPWRPDRGALPLWIDANPLMLNAPWTGARGCYGAGIGDAERDENRLSR